MHGIFQMLQTPPGKLRGVVLVLVSDMTVAVLIWAPRQYASIALLCTLLCHKPNFCCIWYFTQRLQAGVDARFVSLQQFLTISINLKCVS